MCPGEKECISDTGYIGKSNVLLRRVSGGHSRNLLTFQNTCHSNLTLSLEDVNNNLKKGCPFFKTKPENVPENLHRAIESAEILKSYKECGILPTIENLSAREFTCLTSAENGTNKASNEYTDEMTKKK